MAEYTALYLEYTVTDKFLLINELGKYKVELIDVFELDRFFSLAREIRPDFLIIGNPPPQNQKRATEILEMLKADRKLFLLDVILLADKSPINKGEREIAMLKGALEYIVKPVDALKSALLILTLDRSRLERNWGHLKYWKK